MDLLPVPGRLERLVVLVLREDVLVDFIWPGSVGKGLESVGGPDCDSMTDL